MRKWLVSLLAASAPILLSAQEPAPGGPRVPGGGGMLTRSADKYQDLEAQVIRAVEDKSPDALNRLLAEDFDVRSAERADPISKPDWMRAGFAARIRSSRIRDITVREFGDTAVVSFLLERQLAAAAAPSTLFVVDVWNSTTNTLHARYTSTPRRPAPAQKRKI